MGQRMHWSYRSTVCCGIAVGDVNNGAKGQRNKAININFEPDSG